MKLKFSQQIFEKVSNIKFHQNSSGGSQVVTCGQVDERMDRHDKTNSCSLLFCECA
jgi:hypothetical protein